MTWLPILPDTVLSWDTLVSPDGYWAPDAGTVTGIGAVDSSGQLSAADARGDLGAQSTSDVLRGEM